MNEAVVGSILEGDQSVIDAQIAKLEADKASLCRRRKRKNEYCSLYIVFKAILQMLLMSVIIVVITAINTETQGG